MEDEFKKPDFEMVIRVQKRVNATSVQKCHTLGGIIYETIFSLIGGVGNAIISKFLFAHTTYWLTFFQNRTKNFGFRDFVTKGKYNK